MTVMVKRWYRSRKNQFIIIAISTICLIYYISLNSDLDHEPNLDVTRRDSVIEFIERKIEEALKEDKGSGCEIPLLDPFAYEVMRLEKTYQPIKCNGIDWVKCYLSECRVVDKILSTTSNVVCYYQDIITESDNKHYLSQATRVLGNNPYTLDASDHVKVKCTGKHETSIISSTWVGYALGFRKSVPRFRPPPNREDTLNVLIFGFDSTSKNGFIRKMPKSYEYLVEHAKATILDGRKVTNRYRELMKPDSSGIKSTASGSNKSSASSANVGEVNEGSATKNIFSPLVHHSESEEDENGEEFDLHIEETTDYEKNHELLKDMQSWAIKFNIPHLALNELSTILNKRLSNVLPKDARTLLHTNKETLHITISDPGQYWHNGLIKCLKNTLQGLDLNSLTNTISLNINIDGLPVYKSSRHQLWPILCNIFEISHIPPFVIGIYSGEGKPSDLNAYLGSFVKEMRELEENGLVLSSNESRTKVKIRAFICDSPARALIKGVINFNGKHGCLKCTVIGEYSHKSNTVTFPKFDCPKRNDKDFRAKKYEEHHKHDSPLLKLNIDMIEDFPVADSLHLIDLGLMKRLLIGWRDGKLGKYLTKWSARDIDIVNSFLLNCQMPKEIHRKMRSVDVLAHWKGSEYRSFFYYLSVIILKHVLKTEPFYHFLNLFCAITICSNEKHLPLLHIAEKMLEDFTESFKTFYGRDYVTSNIHNLIHIVEEVRKFGILQKFNAHPFENKLYTIKQTIRQGNNPLQQVARRIIEKQLIETEHFNEEIVHYPFIKKNQRSGLLVLHLETYVLSSKDEDKWFLTDENHVIELKSVMLKDNIKQEIEITGYRFSNIHDVFEKPLKSSFLNIYKCDCAAIEKSEVICKVQNVKCKLVSIKYNSEIFFLPLLHTL